MRILVTGGAGFIGSHIADALLAEGHTVDIIDNLTTGSTKNVPEGAGFYELSIDDAEVGYLLDKTKFDVICHHAAQIDVRISVSNPAGDLKNDVAASVTLFEAAVKTGVKQIIFASSGGAIYGEQEYFPADEDHPIQPASPYGLNKWIIERYLDYYFRLCGIGICSLRYANVYGPRQNTKSEAGVIAIFANNMLNNIDVVINGTGEQTRDFVYISDVVAANISAINKKFLGTLNIGTGIETSVNKIFDSIKELTGSNQQKVHAMAKKGEQFRSVLACDKAKKELNWTPVNSPEEGLAKTVDYFKSKISH